MTEPENDAISVADVAAPEPEPAPDSAYYSPSTRGFYHDTVHGGAMPADVIEIGHDTHRALMDAQCAGKLIVPGADGAPVAVDRPGPTPEQRAARNSRLRDAILRDTAWRVAEDEPNRDDWRAYRAKVRAVDVADPTWPDAPAA